jgi:hypothetical protein
MEGAGGFCENEAMRWIVFPTTGLQMVLGVFYKWWYRS